MKIALLPGGFKPPHLGHYNMAKYLADFADKVIVRIGQKEREGIGPELALEVWNFYKEFDPDSRAKKLIISVAQSPSPVKDVYDFVENIAPEGSTVILGLGEKDASDGRYNSIPKFAEPRNIKADIELVPPQSDGISGTRMREIIKSNNKDEFFKYTPEFLPEEIKEEIWTKLVDTTMPSEVDEMMMGTMNREEMAKHNANMKKLRKFFSKQGDQMYQIPTNLTKGLRRKLYEGSKYDAGTVKIQRLIFNEFKDQLGKPFKNEEWSEYWLEGPEYIVFFDIGVDFIPKKMLIPYSISGDAGEDDIQIKITYNPESFPESFNDLNAEIKETVRHELEHLAQYNFPNKELFEKFKGKIPFYKYLTLNHETPAFVRGLNKRAKFKKISLSDTFEEFFDDFIDQFRSEDELNTVRKIWTNYAQENLPGVRLNENIDLKDFTYFETNQGSKYIRKNSTSQLRRIKSYHANTGGKDMGLHGWKQQSIFIDPKFEKEANSVQFLIGKGFKQIALSKTQDGKMVLLIPKDNKWTPATWNDAYPNFIKTNPEYKTKSLTWEYSKEPTIGYHVIDFEIDSSRIIKDWHFGSLISKIGPLSDEDAKLFKLKENYPPYKANQVQQTRYKASDTFTNDRKKAKKLGYLEEMKLFSKEWWLDVITENLLVEGGNIFKDNEKNPLTIRINKTDVDPTLKWLENITKLDLLNNKLGSTGIKSTSGDLDIAVDSNEISKDELVSRLISWVKENHPEDDPKQWVKKSGISVHFKTPINGDPSQGFVQTDLMFSNNLEWMKFKFKGTGDNTPYKGAHRTILMSSIAKTFGYKLSPTQGLIDRDTNDVISQNPDEIASILLGPNSSQEDLESVESIYLKIKDHPKYNEMVNDALNNPIFKDINPDQALIKEGSRIDHAEDIIFWEGAKGALRALEALKNIASEGYKKVTLKWDGSPAIIFGRDENGDFILTDKNGYVAKGYDGKTKSADDLEKMLLSRGKEITPSRKLFAASMKSIFPYYEKAVPQDFRGLFKGDLLYYTTPSVEDMNYIFKPNTVKYAVDIESDLGKKIGKSKTGVVIHRQVDASGNETPLQDVNIFQGDDVLVVPPIVSKEAPIIPSNLIKDLEEKIKTNSKKLDMLLNPSTLKNLQISDFSKILYAYTNSKVDTSLDNLGSDFISWLDSVTKISKIKKERIKEYISNNQNAFTSLWEIVSGIMNIKDTIIDSLDQQKSGIKQSIGSAEGGEGYVLAHPEGDIKLVPRAFFSKANRAIKR